MTFPNTTVKGVELSTPYCNSRFFGTLYDYILKKRIHEKNKNKNRLVRNNDIYKYIDYSKGENTKTETGILKILNRIAHSQDELSRYSMSKCMYDLLSNTDYSLFKPNSFLSTDIQVGSRYGNSIIPDLIIDNKLIDIKTYDKVCFRKDDLIQLIVYCIWINNIDILYSDKSQEYPYYKGYKKYKNKIKINEIGIFFSRQNYLWIININDVIPEKHIGLFNKKIYRNIDNKLLKKEIQDFSKMYIRDSKLLTPTQQ